MFRSVAILLLLFSFSAQSFCNTLIVAEYYMNIDQYAKVCVNKDRPQLRCNGKCQMARKLMEEDNKEKENPLHKITKSEQVLSSKNHLPSTPVLMPEPVQNGFFIQLVGKPSNPSFAIFHPPSHI